ncbi:MAG: hypothetical protein AB9869_11590 [Verrucomicrobiia bacterium]
MTWPVALFFYILARQQRRAVLANLGALRPGWCWLVRQLAGYRLFVEFALTYLDRIWNLHCGQEIRWELEDYTHLEKQLSEPGGVLLFAIHSGNFDIGASFCSQHFPRPIHLVRLPERSKRLQELRRTELDQLEAEQSGLSVHYANADWNLGIRLYGLLQAGEVVAVQGDRSPESTAALSIEHCDLTFRIPKGPFVLAEIARVPCYPILLRRLGRCRYCVRSARPFHDGKERRNAASIGQAWVALMADFIGTHWDQWFAFEQCVSRDRHGPSKARKCA